MASKKYRQRKPNPAPQAAARPPAASAPSAPAVKQTAVQATPAASAPSAPAVQPTAIQAAPPAAPPSTAVAESARAAARVAHPPVVKPAQKVPEPARAGTFLAKTPKLLGSLHVAVVLLALFASVVFLGTWMEHAYSTKIAQELVYRSWWFNCLLLMLAVNIFFAAAKKAKLNKEPLKIPEVTATSLAGRLAGMWHQATTVASHVWPWKRHQFGFLITHVGLLTMLFGGILNGLFGVDAVLQLVDSRDPDVQSRLDQNGYPSRNEGNQCIYSDIAVIKATELVDDGTGKPATGKTFEAEFSGGALPWNASPFAAAKRDYLLWILNSVEAPLGRSWWLSLDKGANLEILDFLPMARREDFAEAEKGFGALKIHFRIQAKMMSDSKDLWLAFDPQDPASRVAEGPLLMETIGRVPMAMLKEFLHPPAPDKLGDQGVLVAVVNGQRFALPLDRDMNRKVPLGESGWAITPQKFQAVDGLPEGPHGRALNLGSSVLFDLWQDGQQQGTLKLYAGLTGAAFDFLHKRPFAGGINGSPQFWFHPPEVASGQARLTGVLQFVQGDDGNLYYRTYTRPKMEDANLRLEKSGLVDLDHEDHPILARANGNFRVLEYYPKAIRKTHFEPVYIAAGKATETDLQKYPAVIHCRLTAPGTAEPLDLWLPRGGIRSNLVVGNRVFRIHYATKTRALGFKLQLERAERTNDPGTGAPATYTSYVLVDDKEQGIDSRPEVITMNEPLHHRGYTFYQATLEPLPLWDNAERPVTMSGFSVSYDPGLPFKYAGSIMLALGIATMFYMKAYFFKPRARTVSPNNPYRLNGTQLS